MPTMDSHDRSTERTETSGRWVEFWTRWRIWCLVGGSLLATLVLLAFAVLVFPPLLVPAGTTDLAKAENDVRGNLVTAVGVFAALVVGSAGFLNWREAQLTRDQTERESRETLEVTRRGQVTDRFSKAVDQLGSQHTAVRTGGLYALEQIVRDSPELHWPVMETLFGFLSQRAQLVGPSKQPPSYAGLADTDLRNRVSGLSIATDVQAALTIISRRNPRLDRKGGTWTWATPACAMPGWMRETLCSRSTSATPTLPAPTWKGQS